MVNLTVSRLIKFGPKLKEIRLHLCQTGPSSKGVREFIETSYVKLKQENPKLPILIRECSGVKPALWARYEKGQETRLELSNLSADEIGSNIKRLNRC